MLRMYDNMKIYLPIRGLSHNNTDASLFRRYLLSFAFYLLSYPLLSRTSHLH